MKKTISLNQDLANAKHIIKITKIPPEKRPALAERMTAELNRLRKTYMKNSLEEQLFLLVLILNLMLYAHQQQQIDAVMDYQYEIAKYIDFIFAQQNLSLSKVQQARWYKAIAKVHETLEFHTFANTYYHKAAEYMTLATSSGKKMRQKDEQCISIYTKIVKLNMATAMHFETKEKAPDLAYEANLYIVSAINAIFKLSPEKKEIVIFSFAKFATLEKLAHYYQKNNNFKKALQTWYEAFEAACYGWENAEREEDGSKFLKHLFASQEKFISLIKTLSTTITPLSQDKLTKLLQKFTDTFNASRSKISFFATAPSTHPDAQHSADQYKSPGHH